MIQIPGESHITNTDWEIFIDHMVLVPITGLRLTDHIKSSYIRLLSACITNATFDNIQPLEEDSI